MTCQIPKRGIDDADGCAEGGVSFHYRNRMPDAILEEDAEK